MISSYDLCKPFWNVSPNRSSLCLRVGLSYWVRSRTEEEKWLFFSRIMPPFRRKGGIISSFLCTISDKIVDTFPFPTLYFVTVIPFCPPSLSFQPPSPPNNVVPKVLWCWGTNKQNWIDERGLFHNFLRDKKTAVIWCTKITMERQCVS